MWIFRWLPFPLDIDFNSWYLIGLELHKHENSLVCALDRECNYSLFFVIIEWLTSLFTLIHTSYFTIVTSETLANIQYWRKFIVVWFLYLVLACIQTQDLLKIERVCFRVLSLFFWAVCELYFYYSKGWNDDAHMTYLSNGKFV